MSQTNLGANCLIGSNLQPVIIRVDGSDRSALDQHLEMRGNCVYLALFDKEDPLGICYTGMSHRGDDRPRDGSHLRDALCVFVIADAGNHLTRKDAEVLERFLFAKVTETTDWKMRCYRPRAGGVGQARFADLMGFGSQVMVQLHVKFGLFADQAARHIATVPREFEPIIYNLFRGPPEGEKVVLNGFGGARATGVNMGKDGFVIRVGSVICSRVVASTPPINAARREELIFNGQLLRLDDEHLVLRRDLWRRTPTSAAKFVTGSTASSANWRPVAPRLRLVRP